MVRAILAGTKTQTRRIIKHQPPATPDICICTEPMCGGNRKWHLKCPHGQPGDQLWVKETFQTTPKGSPFYRADFAGIDMSNVTILGGWKPSIFMPRKFSRITLEITGVRAERLQEISEADALAEGVAIDKGNAYHVAGHEGQWAHATAIGCMETLWDALNAKRGFGWSVNPWVWVLTFKRIK
jgi:hypothetical protein